MRKNVFAICQVLPLITHVLVKHTQSYLCNVVLLSVSVCVREKHFVSLDKPGFKCVERKLPVSVSWGLLI